MLILGIDPGSLRCGFGIIKKENSGQIFHVSHGTIMLDAKRAVNARLQDLAQDLNTLINKYKPTCAVVEDVFVYKNPRSALVLGQARGVCMAVLGLHNISLSSLAPTAVKSLVAGHGRAQKFQVAHMVALQLNIQVPKSPDASDALALAYAQSVLTN